ncbi:MAG: hypothetical protein AzoDbin1_05348 [Azoarcus sp.]|nr:hypothetical protein [Azoarcus sp.]
MDEIHVMKAHCNSCGGERNHERLKQIDKRWSEEVGNGYQISGGDTYYVLECRGCESVKILHESWFSEDTGPTGDPYIKQVYYPSSIFRPHPRWFQSLDSAWHISKLLREIYQAMQNDAPSLAAMGIRAVIEAIMIDKVGDQGTFRKNLSEFQNKGFISTFQLGILEAVLELGHASIHREFIPDTDQLGVALDIMENLVHELYLLEDRAKDTVKNLPKRKA